MKLRSRIAWVWFLHDPCSHEFFHNLLFWTEFQYFFSSTRLAINADNRDVIGTSQRKNAIRPRRNTVAVFHRIILALGPGFGETAKPGLHKYLANNNVSEIW